VSKLDKTANIAVLIVAVLISYILVKQFILHPAPRISSATGASISTNEPLKAKKLTLNGVTWDPKQPTLVLALATYCHFCIDSTSFYQKLADLRRARVIKARIVAVFPQDAAQAHEFAVTHRMDPDQIVSAPLSAIGVGGTPTLLLVGTDGVVAHEWVGELTSQQEEAVVSMLRN
jgi:hypothetical protein